ncbi:MAG: hypothetical protein COB36_10755 [Alphaproteobacteria bacterium]|nr:MAG: hypothetical protein COB36_10755 [Alphaproteobacteria bacterium]
MSEANRVSVKSIPEVAYGTTPVGTSSVWQALRFTSENFSGKPRTQESNEINSNRQISDLFVVGQDVDGALDFEWSADTYDRFMEMAMSDAPVGGVYKIGTDRYSESVEVGFEDFSPIQFLQFKGFRVSQWDMSFEFGQPVTGNFAFAGNFAGDSTTSLVGAGSTTASTVTDVMNATADVSNMQIDGAGSTICFQSLNFSLNNNLRAKECIGSAAPSDQLYGSATITGSVNAYFEDISFYNKLINNTALSLSWDVSDGTTTYTFFLPKIKFSSGSPDATGKDTDVFLNMDFTALYDATEASTMTVTKV